jgi:hypothetical protein
MGKLLSYQGFDAQSWPPGPDHIQSEFTTSSDFRTGSRPAFTRAPLPVPRVEETC